MKVETDDLITQAGAAKLLGVCRQRMHQIVQERGLTTIRIDSTVLLFRLEVEIYRSSLLMKQWEREIGRKMGWVK